MTSSNVTTADHNPTDAPSLIVHCIPAFTDNYLWLIQGLAGASDQVVAVDPGDATPVVAFLARHQLRLAAILVTHHHSDHTGGIAHLLATPSVLAHPSIPVFGPAHEAIPSRTQAVSAHDQVHLPDLGLRFDVIEVPGHTAGHVAYAGHGALFCGDTLFSGGCGRLFEGTAAQMLQSLDAIAQLPPATRVYCAHEYTASNLRFAQALEPHNDALSAYIDEVNGRRQRGEPTIPAVLGRELAINPFLRTRNASIKTKAAAYAKRALLDDAETFSVIRQWKNEFRG
jgi:hydroxyacylglutathione hydrolase